jgi:uncharacterized protein (DUF2384 family)
MTLAEKISQTLVANLARDRDLAEESARSAEGGAAAALDTFNSLVSAGKWLTTIQPILGSADETPKELSRTSEGKAAVCLAPGRIVYGTFGY